MMMPVINLIVNISYMEHLGMTIAIVMMIPIITMTVSIMITKKQSQNHGNKYNDNQKMVRTVTITSISHLNPQLAIDNVDYSDW